jgi:hypothetical protein
MENIKADARGLSTEKHRSRRGPSPSDFNPFHCSVEWHLSRLSSKLAPILYGWGRRLSSSSESFYPSVESMAIYFSCDRTTVFRALQELVGDGWAKVVSEESGKPVVYRFIDHLEWASENPGCCLQKDEMPWEGQGDLLGQRLFSISGGKAKFYPRQMKGLRKFGLDDAQVELEFRSYLDTASPSGSEWRRIYFNFLAHLRRVVATDAALISRSGGSHRSDTHQSRTCDPSRRTEATPTRRTGATQVFECSSERIGGGKQSIPALLSQERPIAPPTKTSERGFPPLEPPKPKAPAHSARSREEVQYAIVHRLSS